MIKSKLIRGVNKDISLRYYGVGPIMDLYDFIFYDRLGGFTNT